MKTILEEFFNGNLDPQTKYFDRNSPFGKNMEIISNSEQKLLELLGDKEKELLQAFSNAQSDLNVMTARENFVSGFKIGSLIMLEVLASKADFIYEDAEK